MPQKRKPQKRWFHTWNFDAWAKIAEVVGFILLGFSFLGRDALGMMYAYVILYGIIVISACLCMMVITKFNENNNF